MLSGEWILKTKIIHDLNNSFERIYGHPQSEFTKNNNLWMELVHPDDHHEGNCEPLESISEPVHFAAERFEDLAD